MKSFCLTGSYLSQRAIRGFTLIELLVVLAIVGVLLFIATPNYDSVLTSSKVDQARQNLATGLALARTEAVNRGEVVRLCSGAGSNASCGTNDTTSQPWVAGWAVVVPGTEVIRVNDELSEVQIQYSCGDYLSFSGTGSRVSSGAGECFFTLDGPGGDISLQRKLWIASSGRMRLN